MNYIGESIILVHPCQNETEQKKIQFREHNQNDKIKWSKIDYMAKQQNKKFYKENHFVPSFLFSHPKGVSHWDFAEARERLMALRSFFVLFIVVQFPVNFLRKHSNSLKLYKLFHVEYFQGLLLADKNRYWKLRSWYWFKSIYIWEVMKLIEHELIINSIINNWKLHCRLI